MNNYEQLAIATINKRMKNYENYLKYKDKQELDRSTYILVEQIKMIHELNLINTVMANNYLSDLKKKYIKKLQQEQFKEYREQIINFNDDVLTDRERLFLVRKTEENNARMSMNEWKQSLNNNKKESSSNNGHFEKEERFKHRNYNNIKQERG